MAGGMLALDVVAGRGQTRRVRVRMRLATVPAAQAAHATRGPFPHGGAALRAVPGEEEGQPVGVHPSSFWAAVPWALCAGHEGSRQAARVRDTTLRACSESDCARTHRFRPRSDPRRSLAARARGVWPGP